MFNATPFNVIALLISLRGTVPSKNGENAGVSIASSPSRKISTKRIAGEIKPASVTMASIQLLLASHCEQYNPYVYISYHRTKI